MKTDTGAISAFILFVGTTCYSFILVNPSLGANFITFGSITVILQAAFPTLVNYILFGIIIGIVFYILRFIRKLGIKKKKKTQPVFSMLYFSYPLVS